MRTTTAKTLSLAAISLLLLTGCQGKEELPAIPDPTTASASTTTSASTDTTANTEATSEATGSTEATAEATASETQNYSGGSKAPEGEYRPADEFGPAQNVPKPVEPEGMNVESAEGLEKFLEYWVESVNYGIQTGDFSYTMPLVSENHEEDITYFAWVENFYNRGGWIDGGLRSVTVGEDLLVYHGDGRYTWGGIFAVQDDCNYLDDKVKCRSGKDAESLAIYYDVHFENNSWKMHGIHPVEGQ